MKQSGTAIFTITLDCTLQEVGKVISMKTLIQDMEMFWEIGCNNLFQIPPLEKPSTIHLYPFFFAKAGLSVRASVLISLAMHNRIQPLPGGDVYSPELNNTRTVMVYTPPSYTENPYKVFLHAGTFSGAEGHRRSHVAHSLL